MYRYVFNIFRVFSCIFNIIVSNIYLNLLIIINYHYHYKLIFYLRHRIIYCQI